MKSSAHDRILVAENGREIILDYAEPGSLVGEIAVLHGKSRTASAIATRPAKVLRIGTASFERLIEGPSQSELGNFAGVSSENVNRQLSAWANEGVIELSNGRSGFCIRTAGQIAVLGE